MAPSTLIELLNLLNVEFLNEHFENNCVDLETLLILQESEIKELVPQVGARRKILNYLKDFHQVHSGPNVFSSNESVTAPELQPSTSSASTVILENDGIETLSNNEMNWLDQVEFKKESLDLVEPLSQSIDSGSQSIVLSESGPSSSMLKHPDSESIELQVIDPSSPPSKKLKGMRRFFPNEQTLQNLILENSKLSIIKDSFNAKGSLLETDRRKLVAIVMDRLLDRHNSVNKDTFQELAINICEEFPTEIASTYYSFNPAVSKNPRGKLCDRYHNELKIRRAYRKRMSVESDTTKSSSSDSTKPSSDRKPAASCRISDELNHKIKWLKHSQEPWETVVLYWMETFQVRQSQSSSGIPLHKFMQNWPILQHQDGHRLVNNPISE